jgi:hypothetical protein
MVWPLTLAAQDASPDFSTSRYGGKRNCVARGGGSAATEDAVLASLKWLARHQGKDGSWAVDLDGACARLERYPGKCDAAHTAPDPVKPAAPLGEAGRKAAEEQIARLSSEKLEAREEAVQELLKLGVAAAEFLEARSRDVADAEAAARLRAVVERLRRRDPSVDRVAVTSLSLLAFLGSGYMALSRDTYDGQCFGDVAAAGRTYLLSRQDDRGQIGSTPLSHVAATAALAEDVALTGDAELRKPLARAVERLGAMMADVTKEPAAAALAVWAVQACLAAKAECDGVRTALAEWSARQVARETPADLLTLVAAATAVLLREGALSGPLVDVIRERAATADDEPLALWLLSSLVFTLDGPSGRDWKKWNEACRRVLPRQLPGGANPCERGSWSIPPSVLGRTGATACRALLFETYYRFAGLARNR